MSPDTPTNGRVTIAVVGTKVDGLVELVTRTNVSVDNMRREQGEMRAEMAVNEERWRNHDRAQKATTEARDKAEAQLWEAHGNVHARENRIITALAGGFSTVSGFISAMINR